MTYFRRAANNYPIKPLAVLISLFLLMAARVEAQSPNIGQVFTPVRMAPGAPAGSYTLSGFENVNPYNGNSSTCSSSWMKIT